MVTKQNMIVFSAIFAIIVVLANYTVQFNIGETYLTYGALIYPISFLFMDILSEKYNKKVVLQTLRLGILFAFIPSFFISQPSIAIASVCAFFISQHLDVYVFFALKKLFPKLWWLRNNTSTIIAQFFDTMIFFYIAMAATLGWKTAIFMALSDFSIKTLLSIANTPFFYLFAIRLKNKIF